jgi:small subunit ribosomal protein S6
MVNQYETVFIVTPVLSEEQMKEAVKKFSALIKDNGAEIVYEDNWGLKKLAYPIQKKSTGFYHLIEFKCEGEMIQKLETEFRRDERIIRFLTVKMEKHAIIFAEKRRKKANDNVQPEKGEEN